MFWHRKGALLKPVEVALHGTPARHLCQGVKVGVARD